MRFSETESVSSVSSVLNRHKAVFKPGLGTIKGHKADIQVKDGLARCFARRGQHRMLSKRKWIEKLNASSMKV